MRALRLMVAVFVVAIAFGMFAIYGSPRDPLRALGANVDNETVSYSEERNPFSGEIVFNCHRSADIRGLSVAEANDILHADHPKPNEQFLFFVGDSHWRTVTFDPSSTLALSSLKPRTGTVLYLQQLTPVQVLWVRMTHIGSNPFGKSIASPGRVERLITARP